MKRFRNRRNRSLTIESLDHRQLLTSLANDGAALTLDVAEPETVYRTEQAAEDPNAGEGDLDISDPIQPLAVLL